MKLTGIFYTTEPFISLDRYINQKILKISLIFAFSKLWIITVFYVHSTFDLLKLFKVHVYQSYKRRSC